MSKCHSCENGFNGRNGNGYMPCGCNKEAKPEFVAPPPLVPIGHPKVVSAQSVTAEDKNLLKKALSQHLKENPLYSKRNKIIAVPESEFQIIQPYYKRASFVFVLGLVIGSLLTYFA